VTVVDVGDPLIGPVPARYSGGQTKLFKGKRRALGTIRQDVDKIRRVEKIKRREEDAWWEGGRAGFRGLEKEPPGDAGTRK